MQHYATSIMQKLSKRVRNGTMDKNAQVSVLLIFVLLLHHRHIKFYTLDYY